MPSPIDCRPVATLDYDELVSLHYTPAMRRLSAKILRDGVPVPPLDEAWGLHTPMVYDGKVYARDQGGWFVPDLTAEQVAIALDMARHRRPTGKPPGGW